MAFFAVTYTYVPEPGRLDAVRAQHRAYLAGLAESGTMRASGPLVGTSPPSALLIVDAPDEDEVSRLVEADPFRKAGLIETWTCSRWNPVIGVFAGEA